MSNRNLAISIIVIIVVAVGVWGIARVMNNSNTQTESQTQTTDQTPKTTTDQTTDKMEAKPEDTAQADNSGACKRNFDSNVLKTAKVDTANKFVTLDVTNFGQIKLQLYDKDAPKTVENFLRLVNSNYYSCITFHRVAKGFVIQAGDPTGTGSGGDSAFGGTFADELNPSTPSYKAGYVKGVLAMANRGPNTNSSQFFIMLADGNLPHSYTIFGKVASGLDVVDKIGKVDINPGQFGATDGAPKVPVVISKATISSK